MTDKRISELTQITGANLADDDEFVVVDTSANETKAITYGELKKSTGDLSAIDTSIADTAVDVFVYDTSKDSDGGAWRKRTQHTSWYNETLNTATRGSRREFPAVAVIIIEDLNAYVYDADDPALPMWGKINNAIPSYSATDNSSVFALNGVICIGGNAGYGGLAIIDLPAAKNTWHGFGQGGASAGVYVQENWNTSTDTPSLTSAVRISGEVLVNRFVNDVAMTVLPDAPIDPATGLPVPTIACLVAETEVLMADGSTKRLDQVQPGEMVKTLEGEHKVLNWWDQGIKDVIELEFDGGHKIICTADHKIRTTTGWVEAGDLTEDHEVVVA